MNIVSARRFGLWTKLFRKWLKGELKKTSDTIIGALPKETSEEQIDSMFE